MTGAWKFRGHWGQGGREQNANIGNRKSSTNRNDENYWNIQNNENNREQQKSSSEMWYHYIFADKQLRYNTSSYTFIFTPFKTFSFVVFGNTKLGCHCQKGFIIKSAHHQCSSLCTTTMFITTIGRYPQGEYNASGYATSRNKTG